MKEDEPISRGSSSLLFTFVVSISDRAFQSRAPREYILINNLRLKCSIQK